MREIVSIHLKNVSQSLPLEELADDDLMRLSRSGRHDAFEVLVRRYQQLVLGLTTRFLVEKDSGRSVAQDVFLSLWAERDRYRARGQFRSYLVSVTLNRCRYIVRSKRKHAQKLMHLAQATNEKDVDQNVPLTLLLKRESAQEVRQALAQLPEKFRTVMILRFTHSLSLEEISEVAGMPLGTVKSYLFRGLKRLHHLLRKA